MTTPVHAADEPGSIVPPLLALAAIGLGYVWASWGARADDLAARTRRRLA